MTITAGCFRVDGEHVARALQEACENLKQAEGEMMLDLSAVRRIDPSGLRAVEILAAAADEKAIDVSLLGVNVDVYKVLKLAKLTTRFSFVN